MNAILRNSLTDHFKINYSEKWTYGNPDVSYHQIPIQIQHIHNEKTNEELIL